MAETGIHDPENQNPPHPFTAALILFASVLFISNTRAAEEFKPAESITQTWQIKDNRLQATMEITLRAEAGDRFLLLESPATLTSFTGQGLKVTKEGQTSGLKSAAKPKGEDGGLKSAFRVPTS